MQKTLIRECERIEADVFERENRLALLKSGDFTPPERWSIVALVVEAARKKRDSEKSRLRVRLGKRRE